MKTSINIAAKKLAWQATNTKLLNPVRPKIFHSNAYYLEGVTKRSECALSAIVFGEIEFAYYFSKLAYKEEPKMKYEGKKALADIPKVISSLKPDLCFINIPSAFSKFLTSNEFFAMPYVEFALDISESLEAIYAKMGHKTRQKIQKIEKAKPIYEVSNDPNQLKFFYDELYVPFILKRHGKASRLISFEECSRIFKKGGLMLTHLDGLIASGLLFEKDNDELSIAIRGESKEFWSKNLGYHSYYSILQWAKQLKFSTINFGSCPPFPKDGLFEFKREWGAAIKPPRERDERMFGLRFCNLKGGAQDFLFDNPIIFARERKLEMLAIKNSKPEILFSFNKTPGLNKAVVVSAAPFKVKCFEKLENSMEGYISESTYLPLQTFAKLASDESFKVYEVNF